MKASRVFWITAGFTFLWWVLLAACSSEEPETPSAGVRTVEELDNLSDHLQFSEATKINGKIPTPSTVTSSLKFNIKDTLFFMESVPRSIKFLHDELTNVAGVYIQVGNRSGPINNDATYYFDVHEAPGTSESDSISVILIGFDPTDIVLPVSFDIIITPYDESGQPLDETELPVVVEDLSEQPDVSSPCGLVNAAGEYWHWESTFYDELNILLEPLIPLPGQYITGCCSNGVSGFIDNCLPEHQRRIYFQTGYEKDFESLIFKDDGTYTRITREVFSAPLPDKTDFCRPKPGTISVEILNQNSGGTWTVKNIAVPGNPSYASRDYLDIKQTYESPPGGSLNRGGIMHQLDCAVLILWVRDPEGGPLDVFHTYSRRSIADAYLIDEWFPFSE